MVFGYIDMKRLIAIILSCVALSVNATKVYVSPSGSNTAGNGTSSNPWQTPAYAISQASAGDTIFFQAGIYQITTQIEVPRAISLYTNEDATIIAGTALNPMFILQSTTQGTDGNQRISGLKFDGDITALSCFSVRRRSNVVFDSCTFIDFLYTAIEIYGGESFTDVPNNFITGFKILNCTIDNCCSRRDPQPFGAIRMGGTEGSEIAYNYLRQVGRNTGENGNLMYSWGAVNRGLYYHHNTSIKPTTDGTVSGNAGGWNFHIESGSSSGYEICYNEFIGGLAIDLAGGIQVKGDYDYAWYIHDNEFSIENQITALPSGTHRPGALDFERTNEDIIVTRNKFINYPTAINLTLSSSAYHYSRITFSYNIFENVGYSDNSYSYGGLQFVGNEAATGDLCSDINILNNTFYGNGARSFILLQQPYNMNNIYIRNNIFLNAVIWGYIIAWDVVGVSTTPTGSLTGFYIDNNLLYNNASNNGIYYRNAKTMTIESYANNIISEPQFVSISTFELSPSSPAIDAGIDVGLTRDFYNRRLVGVPDIGAIEYGAIGGERFGKNRQGVMLKSRDGRMMIYN